MKISKPPLLLFLLLSSVAFAQKQPADYVNLFTGTSNSRWMLFPGPTTPFGMIKLSPDNQENVWNGGYEYTIGSISGFSHLHAMSLSGLSVMPAVGKLDLYPGQPKTFPGASDGPFGTMWTAGYRSRFDKKTEVASPGYYAVKLLDADVYAELTSTTRTGWLRFTFPESSQSRIFFNFNFPVEEKTEILGVTVRQVSATELAGSIKCRNGYADEFTVHFVSQLSRPINSLKGWTTQPYEGRSASYGTAWRDKQTIFAIKDSLTDKNLTGVFAEFSTKKDEKITVRTGISFVSVANARLNLTEESKPFGWDFDRVVAATRTTWNNLLKTVTITDASEANKEKFYTAFYRSYAGKSVYSDVDGSYTDMYEKPQKLSAPADAVSGLVHKKNEIHTKC